MTISIEYQPDSVLVAGYEFENIDEAEEYWDSQANHYSGIDPDNTYDAFVGMNAGDSLDYCLDVADQLRTIINDRQGLLNRCGCTEDILAY